MAANTESMDCELTDTGLTGKEVDQTNKQSKVKNKNAYRENIRTASKTCIGGDDANNVRVSLQPCNVANNLELLNTLISKAKSQQRLEKLQGLKAVFQELYVDKVKLDGTKSTKSFLYFEEVFEIFMGYRIRKGIGPYTHLNKTEFMLDLLHEKYGLAIYTVRIELLNKRILLLRSAEFELEFFLQELTNKTEICGTTGPCSKGQSKIEINRENVDMLLNSVDTEYDKNVAKVILSAGRSRAQIDELGINADNIVSLCEKVALVGQEVKNSLIAAEDLVKLHIKGEIGKLQTDTEILQRFFH